jgi:hypothetical protein
MSERKTVHIWMPDDRSLCDLHARPPTPDVTAMTAAEFDDLLEE